MENGIDHRSLIFTANYFYTWIGIMVRKMVFSHFLGGLYRHKFLFGRIFLARIYDQLSDPNSSGIKSTLFDFSIYGNPLFNIGSPFKKHDLNRTFVNYFRGWHYLGGYFSKTKEYYLAFLGTCIDGGL